MPHIVVESESGQATRVLPVENMKRGDLSSDFARWEQTYIELFARKPDLLRFNVPAKPKGLGPVRLIVVAGEIVSWTGNRPIQGTLDRLGRHFPVWQYADDLDRVIVMNARDPRAGTYGLWVRDTREADAENANLSAYSLAWQPGLTLLERILLEIDYLLERGEHMDQDNWTLCTGSRDHADFFIPGVRSSSAGKLYVGWFGPASRLQFLRSRRVFA